MTPLAPTLQLFFAERLAKQRQASPATITVLPQHVSAAAALRAGPHRQGPVRLDWDDLDVEVISAFLDHLETDRRQQRPQPQRPPGRGAVAVPATRLCAIPNTPS